MSEASRPLADGFGAGRPARSRGDRRLWEHNPYVPHAARLVGIQALAPDHRLFTLRLVHDGARRAFRHRPGQFVMLGIAGTGEAPISLASSPTRPETLELCVRRVGRLTDALFRLRPGDVVGVRGPYGNGFAVDALAGDDLLLVAGGLGMAPLRSLLGYALDQRERFGRVTLLHGARSPAAMLFREEMSALCERSDVDCRLIVDEANEGGWPHAVGRLPRLFDGLALDPGRTWAAVCGPPVVYRYVLERLLALAFPKDRILMSLERRMKCGVGKCGHCAIGSAYTCVDGPIFTYWDALNLPELI